MTKSKIAESLSKYQKLGIWLIVDARKIYSVLARKYFVFTLGEIGAAINKDHASVLHHMKSHLALYKNDDVYTHFFELCEHTVAETEIIQNNDKVSFIDALVAENRLLRTEVEALSEVLSKIKTKLHEVNKEASAEEVY